MSVGLEDANILGEVSEDVGEVGVVLGPVIVFFDADADEVPPLPNLSLTTKAWVTRRSLPLWRLMFWGKI